MQRVWGVVGVGVGVDGGVGVGVVVGVGSGGGGSGIVGGVGVGGVGVGLGIRSDPFPISFVCCLILSDSCGVSFSSCVGLVLVLW
jgi:hypothetical protein